MTLKKYLAEKRLKTHKTSPDELNGLLQIVKRDIADAKVLQISADRRFITAYNAALQLATVLLRASGFRTNTNKSGHHWITFEVLPHIIADRGNEYTVYFEGCRVKRNSSDYDTSGEISDTQANELLSEVLKFRTIVHSWLENQYSDYEHLIIE